MLGEEDIREVNLRSNGLNEGVGLFKPARDTTDGKALLPREEAPEPWIEGVSSGMDCIESAGLPSRSGAVSLTPFSACVAAASVIL